MWKFEKMTRWASKNPRDKSLKNRQNLDYN